MASVIAPPEASATWRSMLPGTAGATGVAAKSWGVENRINAAGTKARTARKTRTMVMAGSKEATGDK